MNHRFLNAVAVALAALSCNPATAHGTHQAKYGGVIATSNDLGFELVSTPTGVALYIDDHGKPKAPAGFSGKLTVLTGGEKTEAVLTAAGDRLEASGVKWVAGSKVVASLSMPSKKALTVRFTIK